MACRDAAPAGKAGMGPGSVVQSLEDENDGRGGGDENRLQWTSSQVRVPEPGSHTCDTGYAAGRGRAHCAKGLHRTEHRPYVS